MTAFTNPERLVFKCLTKYKNGTYLSLSGYLHAVNLKYTCEDNEYFHHGEPVPDEHPGSLAKSKPGRGVDLVPLLRSEPEYYKKY